MNVTRGLRRLGDPTGTTELDWVAAMRRGPRAISTLDNADRLLEWRSGVYQPRHVAVLFNAHGEFLRIAREYQG